jgi:hypothetical protein
MIGTCYPHASDIKPSNFCTTGDRSKAKANGIAKQNLRMNSNGYCDDDVADGRNLTPGVLIVKNCCYFNPKSETSGDAVECASKSQNHAVHWLNVNGNQIGR